MSSPAFMDREDRSTQATIATLTPVPSNETPRSHRNALFCVLIVMGCALLTNPVANMPFSDEFSYDKTALEFARTGHIVYNGWATAMLGWLIVGRPVYQDIRFFIYWHAALDAAD